MSVLDMSTKLSPPARALRRERVENGPPLPENATTSRHGLLVGSVSRHLVHGEPWVLDGGRGLGKLFARLRLRLNSHDRSPSLARRRMRAGMLPIIGAGLEPHIAERQSARVEGHNDDRPVHPQCSLACGRMQLRVLPVEHMGLVTEPQDYCAEEDADPSQEAKVFQVHAQSSLRRRARTASAPEYRARESKTKMACLRSSVNVEFRAGARIVTPTVAMASAFIALAVSFTRSLNRLAAALRAMSSGVTSALWFDPAT